MFFANDYHDERVHINETQSNQTYYCPFCGARLIVKKGDIRQHHFAHSANHHCSDSWESNHSYDMSPWHNEWQSLFPQVNQEIKLSLGETKHRADVMIGRTVIEFQHSIMSVQAFNDRNCFYFNLGYKVVWLFDLSGVFSMGGLTYREENGRLFFNWNNPNRAFNSYDVKSGCIDLFFQLNDNESETRIVRVLDVSEKGFEYFITDRFISKEDFLHYVGLVDGTCALPAREDLEENEKFNAFCREYGIALNKQQERAVQAVEGANLLLAVPGSGKTTVLVARLGHMILNRGIDPKSILAITFNKKAAVEMQERFKNRFGLTVGSQVKFSTINALCFSIYRRYCKDHTLTEKRMIEGTERKRTLVNILSKYSDEYPTENEILDLEQTLAYIKNMMLSEDDLFLLNASYPNIDVMYQDYQKSLDSSGKMDFDDQMVFALDILKRDAGILKAFRLQYKYICVDEAQDTSKIQHAIIRLISEGNHLFMVGDEDQSIYGFRGAYPKALLNFRYDYVNPYIMRMERNYRSTAQIVETAQLFISKYKGRYEKNMTAARGLGNEVRLISVQDREEQYSFLLNEAKNNARETAFLYRDNESSVVLIDLLLRENIPFRLKAPEMNFFGTKAVLDIIAYLKLALNDRDYESLNRICNKGMLYLKKQQLDYAVKDCKDRKLSVFDAVDKQMQYVKREYKDRAGIFRNRMKTVVSLSPFDAVCFLLDNGYERYMEKEHCDISKVEILKSLAKKESTIESFLNRMHFLENQMQKGFETDSGKPVILSTIHSSKGLEYDTVYMVDVYDGRFPSSKSNVTSLSKDNADGNQEERRLFYVGITRAKNSLNLFSIFDRRSSFVEELFPEIQEKREEKKRLEDKAVQERELARRQAEIEKKIIASEERRRKEEEERAKQKALEDQQCYEEILEIIDQQDQVARDRFGRRWVRCEICGEVKLSKYFSSYGGNNRKNLGVCSACSRKRT